MEPYKISLIVAIALLVLEFTTYHFIFLGFATGMGFVALGQYAFDGMNINRDMLVFALSSAGAIVTFRKIFKHKTDSKELKDDDVNQY